jgi:hypothetical protein
VAAVRLEALDEQTCNQAFVNSSAFQRLSV